MDGATTATADNNSICSATLGDITFAVVDAEVLYCGDAPGTIFGVTQINVRIPSDVIYVSPGSTYINLDAGGINTEGGPGSTRLFITP